MYSMQAATIVACQNQNTRILFTSLEMSTEEIFNKIMSNVSNVISSMRRIPARGVKSKTINKNRFYWRLQERQLSKYSANKTINITKNRFGV